MARQGGLILLAGLLLIGGEVAGAIVGSFHAGGATKANDHATVFKQYAESDSWTAVHVLLFMSAVGPRANRLCAWFFRADGLRCYWPVMSCIQLTCSGSPS
jgi:hypothetical protein